MQRALLALALIAGPAPAQVEFPFERTDFEAPSGPSDVAAAGLDGDGSLDLVTVSTDGGRVSFWRNRGDGTLAAPVEVATAPAPTAVVVGRLDGDATPDLAVLSPSVGRVQIYTGAGDGTFDAAGGVALPGELLALAVADLTNDGFDDLVVTEGGAPGIHVAANAGDGTFADIVSIPAHGGGANVAVGDLNGDGELDLVASTTEYGEWGSVVLGGPGLSFGPTQFFPSSYGGQIYWAALGDVDGDGVLDALVAEDDGFERDTIVWKGLGDGTFELLWFSISNAFPTLQTLGDLNGDGAVDVVVRRSPQEVRGYGNTGAGTFWGNEAAAAGAGVEALAVGDFDGDGIDDVVTANQAQPGVSILLSRPEEVSSYGETLSVRATGIQLHHLAFQNEAFAANPYLVLGSASGTLPGFVLTGVLVPLNYDVYTAITITQANVWITDSFGVLGDHGQAGATLTISTGELPPSAAGLTLNHAFVVLDGGLTAASYASAPVSVELL